MYGPASAVTDGMLFVIGGWPNGHSLTRVYDPVADNWEYRTPIPYDGFSWGHAAAVVNDQIYVIGGESGVVTNGQLDPKVLRYDPEADIWAKPLAQIPINHSVLAADAILGKIYVVGTGAHLQIYDPASDRWTQGASLPVPVFAPGISVVNDELYVLGGAVDGSDWNCVITAVQIYDPRNDEWRMGKGMSAPRCDLAAAVQHERVHVFGGFDRAWRAVNTNEQFSP